MKRYFIAIALVIFTLFAFSQDNEKQKAYYSKLVKQNRTAGRILLYGGAGLITLPFIVDAIDGQYDTGEYVGYLSFPIGFISMIVSTTYFNRAAKYRKRVASISFINQPLNFPGGERLLTVLSKHNADIQIKNSKLLLKTIPAVSLKINL